MPIPQVQPQTEVNNNVPSVPESPLTDNNTVKKNKKLSILLPILLALLVVISGTAYYVYKTIEPKQMADESESNRKTAVNSPTVTPTPKPTIQPIVKGSVTYNVSQGAHKGPDVVQMIIDPQEPASGVAQKVTVKARSSQPITNIEIVLKSDNTEKTYPLSLASGTTRDGVWEGSWVIEDTVLYNYMETIKATDANGVSSIAVSIR